MDVKKIAQIAFLKLNDAEKSACENKITNITDNAKEMLKVNMDSVEPTTKIIRKNILREDVVVEPSKRDDLLKNAKDSDEGAFVVPKIVE